MTFVVPPDQRKEVDTATPRLCEPGASQVQERRKGARHGLNIVTAGGSGEKTRSLGRQDRQTENLGEKRRGEGSHW